MHERLLFCFTAGLLWAAAGCTAGDRSPALAAAPDGAAVFRQYCVTCHGADGSLGLNGAKDLAQSTLPLDGRIAQISKGKNLMAPFEGILTPAEIKAVAQYSLMLKKQ